MRAIAICLAIALSGVTGFMLLRADNERPELAITIIGTFWGFFLSQFGLMVYERAKAKAEFVSLLLAARNELQMNRDVIGWITYLVDHHLTGSQVHSFGFAGVDEIGSATVENLLHNHLTYQLSTPAFSSRRLLTIYQTVLQHRREIPTGNVDGKNPVYASIKLAQVPQVYAGFLDWIDEEGQRIAGERRWCQLLHPHTLVAEPPRPDGPRACSKPEADFILKLATERYGWHYRCHHTDQEIGRLYDVPHRVVKQASKQLLAADGRE